jgi:hypothetical protein
MKSEDIFRILNKGKRKETFIPTQKKGKSTLMVKLFNYTGKSIKLKIKEVADWLKNDLTIIFKPVQRFTKKHLEGVDVKSLNAKYVLEQAEREKEGLSTIDKGYKSIMFEKNKIEKDDEFVNWFDLKGNREEPMKNTKCTYTDKYGNKVSLDESYENLRRD